MTAGRDFERLAKAWLELTPDEAPDRLVEHVRRGIDGLPQDRRPWFRVPSPEWLAWRRPETGWLAAIAAIVIVAIAGGIALTRPGPGVVGPSPSHSESPSPSPSPSLAALPTEAPADAAVRGTWLAEMPPDVSLDGVRGDALMSLVVSGTGTSAYVRPVRASAAPHLTSRAAAGAPGSMVMTTVAPDGGILRGLEPFPACPKGGAGTYSIAISPDGLTLTLATSDDACLARSVILSRTWTRSLVADNPGGTGVVAAYSPMFKLTLPAGAYRRIQLTNDAVEIWRTDESVGLFAFKDPQGFLDPCDSGNGRYEIAYGADAFVEYFAQNPGFTTISTEELTIGGRRAVHLVVEAKRDYACATGYLTEFQPKTETSTLEWHLSPGDRDSIFIVEAPGAMVMFGILPIDPALETAILGTVEFLDRLPSAP